MPTWVCPTCKGAGNLPKKCAYCGGDMDIKLYRITTCYEYAHYDSYCDDCAIEHLERYEGLEEFQVVRE